jgi:hypothetical protein
MQKRGKEKKTNIKRIRRLLQLFKGGTLKKGIRKMVLKTWRDGQFGWVV